MTSAFKGCILDVVLKSENSMRTLESSSSVAHDPCALQLSVRETTSLSGVTLM